LIGVADFNLDGKPDYVLYNSTVASATFTNQAADNIDSVAGDGGGVFIIGDNLGGVATADHGILMNEGATVTGGVSGTVFFGNNSTAANGTFINDGSIDSERSLAIGRTKVRRTFSNKYY
jgi:hypothetical protein